MSNKNIIFFALFLIALSSLLTAIPIATIEVVLIIAVTFIGSLFLGYLRKPHIFTMIITTSYLSVGWIVPRYFHNAWVRKAEFLNHVWISFYMLLAGLVIGAVMSYAGSWLRNKLDTSKGDK